MFSPLFCNHFITVLHGFSSISPLPPSLFFPDNLCPNTFISCLSASFCVHQLLPSAARYCLSGLPVDCQMKNITSPDQTSLLLEDLIIWTNYEIEVAAYNGAGRGTFSHKVTEWTLQGGECMSYTVLCRTCRTKQPVLGTGVNLNAADLMWDHFICFTNSVITCSLIASSPWLMMSLQRATCDWQLSRSFSSRDQNSDLNVHCFSTIPSWMFTLCKPLLFCAYTDHFNFLRLFSQSHTKTYSASTPVCLF